MAAFQSASNNGHPITGLSYHTLTITRSEVLDGLGRASRMIYKWRREVQSEGQAFDLWA